MRNNPDTGFITGTIEEKVGDSMPEDRGDLRRVKMRVNRFEDEPEESHRQNKLLQDVVPGTVTDVYLNPRYNGRYEELSVGDEARVHVALISAWSVENLRDFTYLVGDRTEIITHFGHF